MTDDTHNQDFGELFKQQIREMREQFFKLDRLRNEAYGRKLQCDESAAAEMQALEKQMGRIYLSNKQIGGQEAKSVGWPLRGLPIETAMARLLFICS